MQSSTGHDVVPGRVQHHGKGDFCILVMQCVINRSHALRVLDDSAVQRKQERGCVSLVVHDAQMQRCVLNVLISFNLSIFYAIVLRLLGHTGQANVNAPKSTGASSW